MKSAPRLFSMLLRGTALAGKLVVFIALARFLGNAEVGLYGLVAATVAYGTFLTGMEFYNYSMREVAGHDGAAQSHAIINHLAFVSVVQGVAVVAVLLAWASGLITFHLILITLAVTVMEQWAQEGYRLLVALSRPVVASVTLFLRQGAWVFFVIFGLFMFPGLRTLDFVLLSWLVGVGLSALIAGSVLFRRTGLPTLARIDRRWILRGLPVALVFLGAAFGLNTINFLDRFFQARLGSDGSLAAYVMFFGISVSLIAVLDAGTFSFGFPKIVAAARRSMADLVAQVNAILWQTLITTALFVIAAVLFFEYGLELFGIGEYRAFPTIYYALLASVVLQAFSMVPHLGLYAIHRGKVLLSGHLLALAVFVVLTFALRGWSDSAVAIARAGAFTFLLGWKGTIFFRHVRSDR